MINILNLSGGKQNLQLSKGTSRNNISYHLIATVVMFFNDKPSVVPADTSDSKRDNRGD